MKHQQKIGHYINQREQGDEKSGMRSMYNRFLPAPRFLRRTAIIGVLMVFVLLSYGMAREEYTLFNIPSAFANSHNKGSIQGNRINPNGTPSTVGGNHYYH